MLLSFAVVAISADLALAVEDNYEGYAWPWGIGMILPAGELQDAVSDFHWYTRWILLAVVIFVGALLLYCAFAFNAKRNPVPSKTTHHTWLEIAWTVVPILIVIMIAVPSFRLLYAQYDPSKLYPDYNPETTPMLTVKATGFQWYWGYEYASDEESQTFGIPEGSEIAFDALMLGKEELREDQLPNLSVDNELVVPVNTFVRMQITAGDVIHSWAVPAFGWKIDAIPGRLNESYFHAAREGVYYGQCSELCGKDHAFMPIAVRVVSPEQFAVWASLAADDLDAANERLYAMLEEDKKQLAQRQAAQQGS